jgi:hypothetical protein
MSKWMPRWAMPDSIQPACLTGALWAAAEEGRNEEVAQLLARGADPLATVALDDRGRQIVAEANSERKGIRELKKTALPSHGETEESMAEQVARGATAMMLAAAHGHVECVKALAPVSDANARDQRGLSALMHAARGGHELCVRALTPLSDPLARNDKGQTALMHAANATHAACVRLLLPVSDPMAQDNEGWTALMGAAQGYAPDCVKALLPFSDPRQRNNHGHDALKIALRHTFVMAPCGARDAEFECVRLLMPVSDIDAKCDKGISVDQEIKALTARAERDELTQALLALRESRALQAALDSAERRGSASVEDAQGLARPAGISPRL